MEEVDPLIGESSVVVRLVDLAQETVDDVLLAVLQLVVSAICRAARVGEHLPVVRLEQRTLTMPGVPIDHRVVRQLEPAREVVVQV